MLYNTFYNKNIPINSGPQWVPVGMGKRSSKIIPVGVRQANAIDKSISAINCVKPQIYAVFLLGINRQYLLQSKKLLIICSYLYSLSLALFVFFTVYRSNTISNVTHVIFKYATCVEYCIILTVSLVSGKNKLVSFFRNLNEFDKKLNLSKDFKIIDAGYVCFFWISGCAIYSLIEYILMYIFLYIFLDDTIYSYYIMILTHDYEQIFFFMLLRNIYLRLRIIKAHVSKIFSTEKRTYNYTGEKNTIESLSNNIGLDVTSLHHLYDLLHKCAEQLNSAMSAQMTTILLTSGLSTIVLLKILVFVFQTMSTYNSFTGTTILYLVSRAVKYTGMMIVSCYYSSITFTQVAAIRTKLHDAIHSFPLDKIERRKVKAFFQLTKENEFSYALGGVIKLNMSFPLSYLSLCTTYLVISIQFSKFFDD